jgi:hypothetical protein
VAILAGFAAGDLAHEAFTLFDVNFFMVFQGAQLPAFHNTKDVALGNVGQMLQLGDGVFPVVYLEGLTVNQDMHLVVLVMVMFVAHNIGYRK